MKKRDLLSFKLLMHTFVAKIHMGLKFEVFTKNIIGVIDINVPKLEQIFLPHEVCLTYCPNHWCLSMVDRSIHV